MAIFFKAEKSEEASEKVTFEQRREEGKGVSSAYICEKSIPERGRRGGGVQEQTPELAMPGLLLC